MLLSQRLMHTAAGAGGEGKRRGDGEGAIVWVMWAPCCAAAQFCCTPL